MGLVRTVWASLMVDYDCSQFQVRKETRVDQLRAEKGQSHRVRSTAHTETYKDISNDTSSPGSAVDSIIPSLASCKRRCIPDGGTHICLKDRSSS